MPPEQAAAEVTEGNEGTENPTPWIENVAEEHRETFKQFESPEKVLEAIKYTPPKADGKSWRDELSEEDKKVADRFSSEAEMLRSIKEARKLASQVRVPGKDASDEEKTAYFKAIGVPEAPEGYGLKAPEGVELTPEMEAQNKEWEQVLHKAKVPVETVGVLVDHIQKQVAEAQQAQLKADADFVAESEAALKSEWKGEEFARNKEIANKAFKEIAGRAGVDIEDLKHMETKEGRFLFDDPRMMKMFAVFGREMQEGGLGPTLNENERETMQEQLDGIRNKISEAQNKGDSKKANTLFQQEQALIAKMNGNKPVR